MVKLIQGRKGVQYFNQGLLIVQALRVTAVIVNHSSTHHDAVLDNISMTRWKILEIQLRLIVNSFSACLMHL
ncbi:hypothetical protein Peur_038856 [Populus x canadensis]